MLALLVIVLLIFALGYPYLSAMLSRHRMMKRLKKTCRDCGFRFRPLRRVTLLIRNRGNRYDFLIENKTQVLAVKLWSAYRQGSVLVVTDRGRVFERRYAPILMDVRRNAKVSKMEGRRQAVRRTQLPISTKDPRPQTKLLLVYPSYREVLRQVGEQEHPLSSGDVIFDKRLVSPSALERLLREQASDLTLRQKR